MHLFVNVKAASGAEKSMAVDTTQNAARLCYCQRELKVRRVCFPLLLSPMRLQNTEGRRRDGTDHTLACSSARKLG